MELDAYVVRINNTRKRADKNKVLPHGQPKDIFESPEHYGALDFKVLIFFFALAIMFDFSQIKVQPEAIQYVREKYAPPDNPIFELVPPTFAHYATQVYAHLGSPELSSRNIWQVYRDMVQHLENIAARALGEDEAYVNSLDEFEVQSQLDGEAEELEVHYPLIQGRELLGGFQHRREDGSFYLGGVNGGLGLGESHFLFTYFDFIQRMLLDANLEKKLDQMDDNEEDFEPDEIGMDEGDEDYEPDKVGLVFTEDEDDGVESNELDEW